ncbi:MAG: phosphoribosyl-ATP diphosphatase [Pseudomonadota bacterium]
MSDIHILNILTEIIHSRKDEPADQSYTAQLFQKGVKKTGKKVGEEATEVVIAALVEDKAALIGEIADLIYHLNVLMAQKDVSWKDIASKLEERLNISGLEEKAARKSHKKAGENK